jgi:transcriptional regulator with XRE-family HTH domain
MSGSSRSLPMDAPFGVALRWWRERRRLSLSQLGAQVYASRQHLSEVELGHRGPGLDLAKRLDLALDAQSDLARRLDAAPGGAQGVTAVRLPLLSASEAEAQMVELLSELERSDVGSGSIDAAEQVAEHLCSAYSTTSAAVLLPQSLSSSATPSRWHTASSHSGSGAGSWSPRAGSRCSARASSSTAELCRQRTRPVP